ncbi:hypothetical protein [Paludisphaera sp.]|uniref:hypothetical protein n=1 Tax=Paludisphaera sp. TaxID=2017432 RepID=UPI00301C45EF
MMTHARFPNARGIVWIFTAAVALAFAGCGESQEGMTTSSEEHQQATNQMAEFMKNKSKKKGGSAAAPTPPPAPAPESAD